MRGVPFVTIVTSAGFSSSNNLQRLFKARFGTTLSDYRRKSQGEPEKSQR